MPWKETCAMKERLQFIAAWQEGHWSMSALCAHYGISRKTGHKWVRRYQREGLNGLQERSRASRTHPNAIPAQIESQLIAVHQQYGWGPKKVLDYLRRRNPEVRWPARSTVAALFARHGLVKHRGGRRRAPPYTQPYTHALEPNALWSADFKGQFQTGDGRWCYPLTITDSFSRYVLCCQGLNRPAYAQVQPYFELAFRRFGLPTAIRTDNGSPFASTGLAGLSALAVWWIKLGIRPERIKPGCPQQNSRHERMHRTLKAEAASPPKASMRAQQRAFNRFYRLYNDIRPHESLAGNVPADYYRASERPYPRRLAPIEYPEGWVLRRVRHAGEIKWGGELVYVSTVLAREWVGLKPVEELGWQLYFGPMPLGTILAGSTKVLPMRPD